MGDSNDPFMRNPNAAVQARPKVQNRANLLQLKMIGQSHPTGLTNNLLKLFEPRPPLEFKPPPEKIKCPPYTGIGQFVRLFAEPGDPEYAPPVKEAETPAQKKARIHQLKLAKGVAKVAEDLEKYDPQNDPNATGDPYKTLFVSRLSFETSESRLIREFETYGPIKRVKMIYDKETNMPRGYAFIEYAHTRDMKAAYKQADGTKIDGRRVLVDVERGRTVPNWRPRRLGGGLGTARAGGEDANQRQATRELQSGGQSRSEEPRVRGDRDREKSRDRGREREREREMSRERSHDKPKDREHRDDRRHRDRDRTRDKDKDKDREHGRDRDRDRDRRDRDRGRDRGRESEREKDRDHPRDRDRDKDTDLEMGEVEHRGHSRDRRGEKERSYDHHEADDDDQGRYESYHGHKHEVENDDYRYAPHQSRGRYDNKEADDDRYNQYDDDDHRIQYEQMEEDN